MSDALNTLLTEIGVNFSSDSQPPSLVITEASIESDTYVTDAPVRGKLCLNMIVKNESKIIERLLGSVLSIVDTYCICDTGSTDDTMNIIRQFMKDAGKPGEVYSEPFKNFGYNRTHALERAKQWGEYALLIDADMKLVITPEFDKNALTANGYSIIQKNSSIEYYNTRIVKTGIGVRCLCPTHEYYDFPNGGGNKKLSTLWIDDIGDGGCKTDKFERDIRLLEQGLKDEPKNERYHFYLAQSYNHCGRHKEAYEMYKKRVELGGWIEEIFYAALEAGNMAKTLGNVGDAVYWWMEAYNKHPKRAESLYELTKYYRESGKNRLSHIFCDIGKRIPYPKDDVLFIKTAVYEYLFDYETSINAYYTGIPVDHYAYIDLISRNYFKSNVLSNYKFYVKKLSKLAGMKEYNFCETTEKEIMGRMDTFTSSSPSIIPHSEGYLMNVRYVNYKIRPDGGYDFKHNDGKITTLNRTYFLNKNMETVKTYWIDKVQNEHMRYQGVEDVKIYSHLGQVLFLGTVEHPGTGKITVGHGVYDFTKDKLLSNAFDSPHNRGCEKNWAYFHTSKGEMRLVYEWSPLTFAEELDNTIRIVSQDVDVPKIFSDLRGSSNGMIVDDELWFLCHLVQYSTPRHYYHMIVVLDANTLKFKRHSILFKFHDDCIEYSLGFILEKERAIFSFSRMDRTSAVLTLPRDVMDKELFP